MGFDRDGEENGSRIYQLVLHSMNLLPSNIPSCGVVPLKYRDSDNTGKDVRNPALDDSNRDSEQLERDDTTDLEKGKKRTSDASDNDNVDSTKRTRMRMTADSDVEMSD